MEAGNGSKLQPRHPSLLDLRSVTKYYGPTMAVNDVDLSIVSGGVHALLGENGAGKSTLAKIAAGIISPTNGVVEVDGSVVNFMSVRESEELGIVLIPQELNLFGPLSITENLFAGRRRPRNRLGLIDTKRMRATATEILGSLGADFDVGKPAERLSAASRQLVAIARALVLDTRVLIMDEPTAALDDWEAERLLSVIDQLKQSGVGILYVSHRLSEIRQTADKVTILRDGNLVASGPVTDFDDGTIVHHMVGREVAKATKRDTHATEEIALRVTNLSRKGSFEDVTFDLRRGEVVGLAGLIGAGRSELARAICGERPADSGLIEVDGEPVSSTSIPDALRHGVGYVPEERQSQGLLLPFTGVANISLPTLDRHVTRGFVDEDQERRAVEETVDPLSIRGDITLPVDTLSGGNQQKVLLAKWLMADPNVLILDEPTRGVDVGVRADIYGIIDDLASEGRAILVISSDIDEIIAVSDRVLVMRGGRVVADIDGADATQMSIGEAALGHMEGSRG